MSTTLEEALAVVQQLTIADQVRLIEGVATLIHQKLTVPLPATESAEALLRRSEAAALYGSLADVLPSSEDVARHKQAELDKEEGNYVCRV